MKDKRQSGLGRGIDAIFSDFDNADSNENVEEIKLENIRPNPYQPRKTFDQVALKELAESIALNGVFQPIIVRKSVSGYDLVAGERRLRASKLAKKETIPAIVRQLDENQMMEIAVLENLQRENLTPLEEAQAYQTLQNDLKLTQGEMSKRLGKSRPYIANYLRLLALPVATKQLLQSEKISMGQARTLLGLKDKKKIDLLAKKAASEGLTVRRLEKLVQQLNEQSQKTQKASVAKKSPFVISSEKKLEDKFGSQVMIKSDKSGRGKIQIDYLSTEDLNRILDILDISID